MKRPTGTVTVPPHVAEAVRKLVRELSAGGASRRLGLAPPSVERLAEGKFCRPFSVERAARRLGFYERQLNT